MNFPLFIDLLVSPALFTTASLGLMVGAFYGFPAVGDRRRPEFPAQLWTVGLAFVVALAILGLFREADAPFSLEGSLARAALWTLLCVCIPIGRGARIYLRAWTIRRRTKTLQKKNREE